MCGICGQYNFRHSEPVKPERIKRMTSTMVHRGPDDEGYYFSGPVGFGFRRLSIIDLGGGPQPMSDRDESGKEKERKFNRMCLIIRVGACLTKSVGTAPLLCFDTPSPVVLSEMGL
jgi:hypothetical protein